MHEPLLALAALPTPVRCLGVLLQPYSLGHELTLVRVNSPLAKTVDAVRAPEMPDLQAAVAICCQGWAANSRMYRDIFSGIKLRIFERLTARKSFEDHLAAFLAYQSFGMLSFPPSEIVKSGVSYARKMGTPFILSLHRCVMQECRLNESDAWDYPFGLAKMRWQCALETEQKIEVKNEDEAEFDRWCAEMDAKEQEATCPA